MSESYCAYRHTEWQAAGLPNADLDIAEFVNQRPDYGDSLCGEWYFVHDFGDGRAAIVWGTFGNDHSPGASHYTYAEVYGPDERDDLDAHVAEWSAKPEYLDDESEDEDE